jgi:DNA mismatch repair protein MutL
MPIQVLSPETALKIAAGEVIERPASVVKELIENSLDAGAKTVRVEIKNGGLNYLRVSDDGSGISFNEVPLAFERHATSKIAAAEDLYDLHTLGFRGEALPSIAAVSQLTLLTRPRTGDEGGSEITLEGGKIVYHRPAGAPGGTVITVRNLFFNLPARQKWSRSGTSEAGHILTIVNNYALAYPDIKFSLVSEGRLLLQTSGSGNLRDAVAKIYGAEASNALLDVDSHPPQADADGVITEREPNAIRVCGVTSEPNYSKPNRNFMTFFVNKRWVISRTLSYAVQEAYHSLLQTGRFPVCVLLLDVDPAQVDANVHPAKTEVRFLHERQAFVAVQNAVRAALQTQAGGGTVWQAPDPAVFTEKPSQASVAMTEKLFAPLDTSPFVPIEKPAPTPLHQASLDFAAPTPAPVLPNDDDEENFLLDEIGTLKPRPTTSEPRPASDAPPATGDEQASSVKRQASIASPPENPAPSPQPPAPVSDAQQKVRQRLPLLRVLGQMSHTYIVTEGPDGMYLLDQHAAHERVMYEQFQAKLAGRELDRQLLLEPMLLNLTARQMLTLQNADKLRELAELGFVVEPGDDNSFWLRAQPVSLLGRDVKLSLLEMLDEADGVVKDDSCHPSGHDAEFDVAIPRTWRDKLAASLACHSAIRAGQILTTEEMRELIVALERTAIPNACAHGRPTMIYLSQGQLEKGFGRK